MNSACSSRYCIMGCREGPRSFYVRSFCSRRPYDYKYLYALRVMTVVHEVDAMYDLSASPPALLRTNMIPFL
jgi:hypothetical protein